MNNKNGNNSRFRFSLNFNSSGFILILLLILLIPVSSCNQHLISSPEGTITSHVQDKEVLVYAPRAARAQKVVFDTSDKQMIHEPDTPFRRFFNDHTSDFSRGNVDYAKTTILKDIVSRVNNKEFIRSMLHEIIERHKEYAIAPSNASDENELNSIVDRLDNRMKKLEIANKRKLIDLNELIEQIDCGRELIKDMNKLLTKINHYSTTITLTAKNDTGIQKTKLVVTETLISNLKDFIETEISNHVGLINAKIGVIRRNAKTKLFVLEKELEDLENQVVNNANTIQIRNYPELFNQDLPGFHNEISTITHDMQLAWQGFKNEVNEEYFDISEVINKVDSIKKYSDNLNTIKINWAHIINQFNNLDISYDDTDRIHDEIVAILKRYLERYTALPQGDINKEFQDLKTGSFIQFSNDLKGKFNIPAYLTPENQADVKTTLASLEIKFGDLKTHMDQNEVIIQSFKSPDSIRNLLESTRNVNKKILSLVALTDCLLKKECNYDRMEELKNNTLIMLGDLKNWKDSPEHSRHNFVLTIEDSLPTIGNIAIIFNETITPFIVNTEELSKKTRNESEKILTKLNEVMMVPDSDITLVIKKPDSDGDAIRDRNAKLLEDALYHALLREDYPLIRDENIEHVIKKFSKLQDQSTDVDKQYHDIWSITTLAETTAYGNGTKAFVLDLKESLREKRFFKRVIDDAVAKRLNLFKSGGSPVQPMNDAIKVLKDFVTYNLSIDAEFNNQFKKNQNSLWQTYWDTILVNKLWNQIEDRGFLSAELVPLNREIRQEFIVAVEKYQDLTAASKEVLGKYKNYIIADTGDTSKTGLQNTIGQEQHVLTAFKNLTDASKNFTNNLHAKYNEAKNVIEQSKKDYKVKVESAINHTGRNKIRLSYINKAHVKAEELRNNITLDAHNDTTSEKKIINWASVLNDETNKLNSTPPYDSSKWTTVQTESFALQDKLIQLDLDKELYDTLDNAVKSFNGVFDGKKDYVSHAKTLKDIGTQFKIEFINLESNALSDSITAFLVEVRRVLASNAGNQELSGLADKVDNNVKDLITNTKNDAYSFGKPVYDLLKEPSFQDPYKQLFDNYELMSGKQTIFADRKQKEESFYKAINTAIDKAIPENKSKVQLRSDEILKVKEEVKTVIKNKISPEVNEDNLNITIELAALLELGFNDSIIVKTSTNRSNLRKTFVTLFKGYANLIESDEPILTAILKSGRIKFASKLYANKATIYIPKELGSINLAKMEIDIEAALKLPQISYLFGVGSTDEAVVDAFKTEFYNAFKHRLTEAVKAEREAKYDYWWLTFYPKAIPLGDNKLEGQSIIEVGFQDSIVPESQYHRWLQDQAPENAGNRYKHKTRLATSVLSDLMMMLDDSDLIGNFSELRGLLLGAIQEFGENEYRSGIRYLYNRAQASENQRIETIVEAAREAAREAAEAARKNFDEINADVNTASNDAKTAYNDQLKDFMYETMRVIKGLFVTIDGKKVIDSIENGKDISSQDNKYIIRSKDVIKAIKDGNAEKEIGNDNKKTISWKDDLDVEVINGSYFIKNKEVLWKAANANTDEYNATIKITILPTMKFDFLKNNIDIYKNSLAWEDFDIRHVFFAVLAAAEMEIPLPVRVELFTNAYFDGIRRFTQNPSDTEGEMLNRFIPDDTVMGRDYREKSESLGRYLILKGYKPESVYTYLGPQDLDYNEDIPTESVPEEINNLELAKGAKYTDISKFRDLIKFEKKLDKTREELQTIIVNLFYSSYPGFPDPERIKLEFLSGTDNKLESFVYQWLRDLWKRFNDPTSETKFKKGPAQNFADNQPFLTRDSKNYLVNTLSSKDKKSMKEWLENIEQNQSLMDQLRDNLFDHLYGSFLNTIAKLEKIERKQVEFTDITKPEFEKFRNLSKPKVQKNIQIIDMLPASRDDLVSMSVNEGGVIAKIAAKGEAAAAYDLNKLQMLFRNMELLNQAQGKELTGTSARQGEGIGTLTESVSQIAAQGKENKFKELSELSRAGESLGYSVGASGRGSVYARAKAAYAYSRKREYLDAAITAAGRGDNFAKWVVRKSDLRSNLAQGVGNTLVAAAHTGYPNGDQPFHLLIKIPWSSHQYDWDGIPYILFNSSYAATKRTSWLKRYGNLTPVVKGVFSIWNYTYWHKVEESAIGTVYPFMWNVDKSEEQKTLLQTPNILGGRIQLDDTDKIKYSEIATMVQAEENFISVTRQAQLTDINTVMDSLPKEAEDFRSKVREQLNKELKDLNTLQQEQRRDAGVDEKQQSLENNVNQLMEDVKLLQEQKLTVEQ